MSSLQKDTISYMKFKSKKDLLSTIFTFGFSSVMIGLLVYKYFNINEKSSFIFADILIILVVGLLLWLYFDTAYELNKNELKYKSGPFRGKIAINRIKKIYNGKTLWSGFKPATARNGLLIKYDKFEEIYISPKTNETFIEKILEYNNKIKIYNIRESS